LPTVDLRSDTVTRPDAAMRAAIANAEVGDHVLGDDPTAAELERYAAELVGKEAALFFPSGIMANQTAILVQSRPGTEVVLDAGAHILHYEEGAAAAWAGVQLRPVANPNARAEGQPNPDAFAAAIRTGSPYLPQTTLMCLENTHNSAGGTVVSVETMESVVAVARQRGLAVHLDGARLPNAAISSGRAMGDWAALVDTVMFSLSKGLGAPVGSILAGSREVMDRAWRVRRRLGGGMRQAGILAAAGLYALRNNFPALADDHRRARHLAASLAQLSGVRVIFPETNIVMVDVDSRWGSAVTLVAALEARGVRVSPFGVQRLRAVTHRDVTDDGIRVAIDAFRNLLQ
jgi:threonine aldolase